MGEFGLTLNADQAVILGWGELATQADSAEVEYMFNANLGAVMRGNAGGGFDYSFGGEIGGSYMHAHDYQRGSNVFGWNAGLKADILRQLGYSEWAPGSDVVYWGAGIKAGYKGERYWDGSVENGYYLSIMLLGNWPGDNRCVRTQCGGDCANRSEDEVSFQGQSFPVWGSSFTMGIGPYVAYFPGSGRGEAGLQLSIGADPFLI